MTRHHVLSQKLRRFTAIAPVATLVVAGTAVGLTGAMRPARAPHPAVDPRDFTDHITNSWFPLAPGTTYVYDGTKNGVVQRNATTVTHEHKTVLGVHTVVVRDVVTEAGRLVEDTHDWYAQDRAGNVWYFGEDSRAYDHGHVDRGGSWQAGVDGAQAGIVMEARPARGDVYRQEFLAGRAEDTARVTALDVRVRIPSRTYRDALATEEFTPLEPGQVEHKYYAPGVGFVRSDQTRGDDEHFWLVSVTHAH